MFTVRQPLRRIEDAEILCAWAFPAHLLARARRLRWVQAMGAGVDRFLVPELPEGTVLTRAPVFGPWMVEYVFGGCAWVTQKAEAYRQGRRAAPRPGAGPPRPP